VFRADQRDTQVLDARRQHAPQHPQRLFPLADHQHPQAVGEQCHGEVRDGVGLAGARRALHDRAVVLAHDAEHAPLFGVVFAREQRVIAEHFGPPPGRRFEPSSPFGGGERAQDLCHALRHRGRRIPELAEDPVVEPGDAGPVASPQDQRGCRGNPQRPRFPGFRRRRGGIEGRRVGQ
jgi:hypothetical protein